MRAREFIFEDYKDAKKEFSRVADPAVVQATIDQYKELVKKNQFRNPIEKNIDHWRGRGWEAFSQMVKVKSNDVTDTQLKKGKVAGKTIILQNDTEWVVVIPLDKESSVHYGKHTEWCTTKSYWSYFEDYMYQDDTTLIYAIDKTKAGRSVAISIDSNNDIIEMFDQTDKPIDSAEYTKISGLDSEKFIQLAELPENTQQLQAERKNYKLSVANTKKLLKIKPLDPDAIERELKFTKNGTQCYNYILAYGREQNQPVEVHSSIIVAAANHIDRDINYKNKAVTLGKYINFSKIPIGIVKTIVRSIPKLIVFNYKSLTNEQQQLIPTSANAACVYATEVLKKPFPAGEAAILTDLHLANKYAVAFFKGVGWPAGEAVIATSSWDAYLYATGVLKKPFPAGEAAIAQQGGVAQLYAYHFFKGVGWPLGEAAIATDAETAYAYANNVLNNPFPAGEAAIATSAKYSCQYAEEVLEKPFPAGEPAILTDEQITWDYLQSVLNNHRSPSWENLIKDDAEKSYMYAIARNKPFPAGEAAIAKNPLLSGNYALALNKPFPAGEAAIATNADAAKKYNKQFGTNLGQQ